MSEVSIVKANLATVCIESFLYGIFFVLSVTSMFVSLHHRRPLAGESLRSRLFLRSVCRSPMFIAAIVLTMTITAVSSSGFPTAVEYDM